MSIRSHTYINIYMATIWGSGECSPPPPPPPPTPPPRPSKPPPLPHHHHASTTIPSPHFQLRHTSTTPTDHHRTTTAQRFAPTSGIYRRRKAQLLAGEPAPTSSVITMQHTQSPPDLAVSVCTRQNLVSAMVQSSSQQPFLFHSKQTHTDTASSGSAAGPVWQLASDGALDLNGGAILSLVRFGLLAQLPLCR